MSMKIWNDICVRQSSSGNHFLLQVCQLESGQKIFRNRPIDSFRFGWVLFHGFQGIVEKIIK
jgi:hypothetical protein